MAAMVLGDPRLAAEEPRDPSLIRAVVIATPAFADRNHRTRMHPPRGGRSFDYEGYSIELWRRVLRELNEELKNEASFDGSENFSPLKMVVSEEVKSGKDMVELLVDGRADVGLGALTINEERMKLVDFSFPIYESGYQVLIPAQRAPADLASLLVPFRQLLKRENLFWIILLVGTLLVISHLVWAAERRINARAFPDQYHRGIGETLWWSLSTLMSGGCEEKPVHGKAGRFVAILWMFGALMLATFVQSTVTTSMVTSDGSSLHGLENFNPLTAKFGLLHKSAASDWLHDKDNPLLADLPRTESWEQREEVLAAVREEKVDGWVHDSAILHHYAAKDPRLRVLGKFYGPHSYAFMFRRNFPYRERINRILVRLKSRGEFERLERRWIGNVAKSKTSG
jgi:polar amino acid transport system substrate-binding protein